MNKLQNPYSHLDILAPRVISLNFGYVWEAGLELGYAWRQPWPNLQCLYFVLSIKTHKGKLNNEFRMIVTDGASELEIKSMWSVQKAR